MAFNTPFKLWKRYEFNGGHQRRLHHLVAQGIKAKGEIRTQYHHAIDLVPTILDVLGQKDARDHQGPRPEPLRRREHALQLRRPRRPERRGAPSSTPCWDRVGSGTTAGKRSPPIPPSAGWGNFGADTWELYHTEVDRSEVHDLAEQEPERLQEMINLWHAEARRQRGVPLRRPRRPGDHHCTPRRCSPLTGTATSTTPTVAEVPESQAVNVRNRRIAIGALVDIPAPGASGVLFAHGSRFGGHALYIKDNRLHYVYNFVGIDVQTIVANVDVPTGENLILSASFDKDGEDPPGVATGTLSLFHGETKVGEGRIKTQPGQVRHRPARVSASDGTAASR